MEPANPAGSLSSLIERWNDPDQVSIARNTDRWTVNTDSGAPFLLKLEGGDHSLAGIFRDTIESIEVGGAAAGLGMIIAVQEP